MRRYLPVLAVIAAAFILAMAVLKITFPAQENVTPPISDDNATTDLSHEEDSIPYSEPESINDSLIAHAGGAVYGYKLTNSLEALDNSYANGFRIFELDFERTADDKYVLLHDWDSMAERMFFRREVLSYDEFHSSQTFAELTLLDLDMLLDWLQAHENCYIVTDAKCGNELFLPYLYAHAGELAESFIPQAYSFEGYQSAIALGFEKVILTLYKSGYSEDEIFAFAKENHPYAITIPKESLTETLITTLTELGIRTYAHTVNELYVYEDWNSLGLYGIYTDYFQPAKWPY